MATERKHDRFGKYHLFGDDHDSRIQMAKSIGLKDILDDWDNCGGCIP